MAASLTLGQQLLKVKLTMITQGILIESEI